MGAGSAIKALAADKAAGELKPFEYDPKPLGPDDVEIQVEYCGICHSDLSMLDNDWGMSTYPLVAGHEVAGKISATGRKRKPSYGRAAGRSRMVLIELHALRVLSQRRSQSLWFQRVERLSPATEASRIGCAAIPTGLSRFPMVSILSVRDRSSAVASRSSIRSSSLMSSRPIGWRLLGSADSVIWPCSFSTSGAAR